MDAVHGHVDRKVSRLESKLGHLTDSLANTNDLTQNCIVKSLLETEGESFKLSN